MRGGALGGSGQYVYQLGPKGWDLCQRDGRYFPMRSVNYHTLAIVDAFTALLAAQHAGQLAIERFDVEDDAHRVIAGQRLTPDLFVRIKRADGRTFSMWLEVDLGTERSRQIGDKLTRYRTAYEHATTAHLDEYPAIVFLVPDALRAEQINDSIKRQPADARPLFRVIISENFPAILL